MSVTVTGSLSVLCGNEVLQCNPVFFFLHGIIYLSEFKICNNFVSNGMRLLGVQAVQ